MELLTMCMIKLVVFVILSVFIVNSVQYEVKIVNGNLTDIKDHPWQAAINVKVKGTTIFWHYHICGAVIIGKKWILTALHCFEDKTLNYDVRVGTSKTAWWGSIYKIKRLIPHPDYINETRLNDIAIIELWDDLNYDEKVSEIKMANSSFRIGDNMPVKTSGFGKLCLDCDFSDDLMELNLSTISFIECEQTYTYITNKTICAIDPHKKSTTCRGDSGGPLSIKDENNVPLLIGVTRGGFNCNATDPVTFSFIPGYRDWIKKETGI